MTFLRIILAIVLTSFSAAQRLYAQDYIPVFSQDYSSRLSLEIDPATFILRGYSFHVRYQPMFSERFLIGVGTYAFDMPQALVNMNGMNKDEGWKVKVRNAYSLYGELFFTKANHGWFIGEQVGFQRFRVSNNKEATGLAKFNCLVLMTYLGYSWHPYKGSFYIKPWLGLGYTSRVDGTNTVGSMRYDVAPLTAFFTFHIGYSF
jgi:hypothetical protein